ncbi:hypothetical protein GQX73_g10837 [Xylaria multiplex]|uniref:Uncharacterized protein n=1 Tax=Xylaria multiplex TaxID=323545 RepID=A0A7C8MHN8_9PEZI|nr:hypothetical protein GQX73_g10837 [Xylaria multiplex]
MSTAVLTRTDRQDHITTSVDSFAAQQGAVTPSCQAILRLALCYDSVTFDFSSWTTEHINESTASFALGSRNGSLDIGCYNLSNGNLTYDVHATSLAADSEDPGESAFLLSPFPPARAAHITT